MRATTPAIRRLQVHQNIRQVDAHEAHAPRTIGFYAGILGSAALIQIAAPTHEEVLAMLYGLCGLLVTMLFRPWHRRLNVDADAMLCRLTWVLFGVLPVRERGIELADRQLAVDRRRVVQRTGEDSTGLGCLALALPFPFSLLMLFAKSDSNDLVAGSTVQFFLVARATDGSVEDLVPVQNPDTARPFLEAVDDLLPGHARI